MRALTPPSPVLQRVSDVHLGHGTFRTPRVGALPLRLSVLM